MKIIVARYNEDVKWANEFPNVIIYNKGDPLDRPSRRKLWGPARLGWPCSERTSARWGAPRAARRAALPLETWESLLNVGREGHTYYKYIYDNYDTLDDYTIFLQGNPFDHSPNILEKLRKYTKAETLDIDFEYLSELQIHYNLGIGDWFHHPTLPLVKMYEYLFNEIRYDINVVFGAGAQFIVSKQRILQRSRDFYLKIINLLEYDVNPIEGHIIERFHPIIFSQLSA